MRLYLMGITYDPAEDGDAETMARDELRGAFGTTDDCLMIDVTGTILFNSTGIELDEVYAS